MKTSCNCCQYWLKLLYLHWPKGSSL